MKIILAQKQNQEQKCKCKKCGHTHSCTEKSCPICEKNIDCKKIKNLNPNILSNNKTTIKLSKAQWESLNKKSQSTIGNVDFPTNENYSKNISSIEAKYPKLMERINHYINWEKRSIERSKQNIEKIQQEIQSNNISDLAKRVSEWHGECSGEYDRVKQEVNKS